MATKRIKPKWPARRQTQADPFRVDVAQHLLVHEYHVATQKIVMAISMQARITVDLADITVRQIPALEFMLGVLFGIFTREQIQTYAVIVNGEPGVMKELSARLAEIRQLYEGNAGEKLTLSSACVARSLYWDRPMLETEAVAVRSTAKLLGVDHLLTWSTVHLMEC